MDPEGAGDGLRVEGGGAPVQPGLAPSAPDAETFERERDLELVQRLETDLAEVEDALRRLDDGSYGRCQTCGRPIDARALDREPLTRLCADHRVGAEQQAGLGQ